MRVLVTGSEGYIGSLLAPALAERGHSVVGLDTGLFADGALVPIASRVPVIWKDIRDVERSDVAGFDCVIHLAGLSNDPLGHIDPKLTQAVNLDGTLRLAEACRSAGVARFRFSPSCSLYGRAGDAPLDETATFAPQTPYAESKMLAERGLARLAAPGFSPVFLRNATACGISPRQRFDLVLPNLCGSAHTSGVVRLTSDGSAWRPLVHVLDICSAFDAVLNAPTTVVHNQAFNIGTDGQNFTVRQIAETVARGFPGSRVAFGAAQPVADTRSYRVSFEKAHALLPAWRPRWTVPQSVSECRTVFAEIGLSSADFGDRRYTRLAQIEHLRRSGAVGDDLRSLHLPATEAAHECEPATSLS